MAGHDPPYLPDAAGFHDLGVEDGGLLQWDLDRALAGFEPLALRFRVVRLSDVEPVRPAGPLAGTPIDAGGAGE